MSRVGPTRGENASATLGQHHAGQPQDEPGGNAAFVGPCQVRRTLPVRECLPLQSTFDISAKITRLLRAVTVTKPQPLRVLRVSDA